MMILTYRYRFGVKTLEFYFTSRFALKKITENMTMALRMIKCIIAINYINLITDYAPSKPTGLNITDSVCIYSHYFTINKNFYPAVFKMEMPGNQCRDSQCGDRGILRPSYLHNENSCTGKTSSLYCIRTIAIIIATAIVVNHPGTKPSSESTPGDHRLVFTELLLIIIFTSICFVIK